MNEEIKVRRCSLACPSLAAHACSPGNTPAQTMLDDALVAAELAKAEEAAARNGSRLEREAARVLRERAQLLEKSASLESKALQSQWHQARPAHAARPARAATRQPCTRVR